MALSIVLLAGCSGVGLGPGSPSVDTPTPANTSTPTATPATTSATPTEGRQQFPPGLAADGVEEPFTALDAHASALREKSYTVHEVREIRYANGTLYTRDSSATRVSSTPGRYLYRSTVNGTAPQFLDGTNGTLVHYSNGSAVFRKTEIDENASYGIVTGPGKEPVSPTAVEHGTPLNDERIAVLFGALSNASVTQQDDFFARVTATSLSGESVDIDGNQVSNVTAVSFTATVGSDGQVREYRLTLRGTLNGHEVNATEHVTYTDVDSTTVEPPAWYDNAASNSTA
ncbi:DUF7537 family lipoprotein [Haloferax mucosum]|uniref:DUF7537 family lipoprotein n=1 Tax=Haloferax mucosum TaxID=403181 RepID=UPI000320C851|nr:hypothetical protein [Haloferax mucosum]